MHAWKERGLRHLAACAAELVVDEIDRPAVDVITAIPPDPVRQLRRGDHPSDALARELSARWQLELARPLERRRTVERQASLPLTGRRANLRGAFAGQEVRGRVLLVDDVYTTGSTVAAAATALRKAGASSVEVVTFARAARR